MKGTLAKVPKAVAAAVDCMIQAVMSFGPSTIDAKTLLKSIPVLFDNKDGAVRDKAKALTVEFAGWLGRVAVQKALLEKMRESQKKEVEVRLLHVPSSLSLSPMRIYVSSK